jgi:hypothetical protein
LQIKGAEVPILQITALGGLQLVGEAINGTDTVVLSGAAPGLLIGMNTDSVLNLEQYWNTAELNVFGAGGGSEANFNSGSTIVVTTSLLEVNGSTNAPTCGSTDFTEEINNLTLVPPCLAYPSEYPYIEFTESNAMPPPVLVSPANGATGVPVTTSLTWNAVSGSAGYQVYLGTTNPPGIQELTGSTYFTPSTPLNPSTPYYWQVASRDPNNGNAESPSQVWSFTTGLAQETVSTPSTPAGPISGTSGVVYSYSTGGSSDNLGNPVQYQFSWGDGTYSGWLGTGTTSASHSWAAGSYGVTAQARSATNTAVVSSPSGTLTVNITAPESVSAPSTPSGPTSGTAGTIYSYLTGGSTDNLGNPVQYLFNWGDGTNSGWLSTGTTSASHSWAAGSYGVTAQARSATNTSVVSSPSGALTVNIKLPESVSAPSTPSGPTSGMTGISYSYATGGSSDNLGNAAQYQFTWGDGTYSGWLNTGTTSASHTWQQTGNYSLSAQARSAANTSVVSSPSGTLTVNITAPESVSAPSTPSGPTSGTPGTSYSYSTGGSSDNLGNAVQYQFTWGDGTNSGWLATGTTSASHSWAAGSYSVTAQARSATNTSVVSSPSGALTVNIKLPESVSAPSTPSGPTSDTTGTSYSYSTGGSSDNLGNAVQYQFTWGDGTYSGWLNTGTTSASHTWQQIGSYSLSAQARSAANTSGWSVRRPGR